MAPEKLSLDKSYSTKIECAQVLKDYVPGDMSFSELSPVVRYDPQLQNQFARYGYAIMQIGDQLRTVYAGTNKLDRSGVSDGMLTCPVCGQRFTRADFEDHTKMKLVDPNSLQNQQVTQSGNVNPSPYLGMPAGQNLRTEMSSWDRQELQRASRDFWNLRKGAKLALQQIEKVPNASRWIQKNGAPAGTEHEVPLDMILRLPIQDRIFYEVWTYFTEYGSPVSKADISTELASRGYDQEWQEKTEKYAHQYEQQIVPYLQALTQQGLIREVYGGFIPLVAPAIDQTVQKDTHEHYAGEYPSTRKPGEVIDTGAIQIAPGIEGNQKIQVTAPGKDPIEGTAKYATSAGVFYQTGDGKMHIALRDWVKTQNAQGEWGKPEGLAASAPKIPTVQAPKGIGDFKIGDEVRLGSNQPRFGTGDPVPTDPNDFTTWYHGTVTGINHETGKVAVQMEGWSKEQWVNPKALESAKTPEGEGWKFNQMTGGWDRPKLPGETAKPTSQAPQGIPLTGPGGILDRIQTRSVPLIPQRETSPWKIERFEEQKSGEAQVHDMWIDPKTGDIVSGMKTVHFVPVTKDDLNNAASKFTPEQLQGVHFFVADKNTAVLSREYLKEEYARMGRRAPSVSRQSVTLMNEGGMQTLAHSINDRWGLQEKTGLYSNIFIGNQSKEFDDEMHIGSNEEAIVHELAHHNYFCNMSDSDRFVWDRLYDKQSFQDNVSKYAGRNAHEGYAEAYRMYVYHPDTLKEKLPYAYSFIEKTNKAYALSREAK